MLDLIRSNSQSTGVKIAFSIIILVFVFWGIGSFTDTGSVNVVGMVNDQPLTFQQFELAYRHAEESVSRGNSGGRLGEAQKRELGRNVFQSLVGDMLVCQEAERNSLSVSPVELRLYVNQIKAFQNDQGKFDPEVYKRVLSQQRQTPAQFEESIAKQMLKDKYLTFATGGVWTGEMEPRARYNFLRQRREVEYVFVSSKEGADAFKPDDAACAAFYESHKGDYAVPQKVKVEYIFADPLTLVKPEAVSAEEVRKWYDSHLSAYTEPKSVEASHILVQLPQKAADADVKKAEMKIASIKAELAKGASFEALADKYNAPNAAGKGGKLGWITPGMTVPEFEIAAFAARPGLVAGPVRTAFGLHLILVSKVKDGGVKPFEEVEKQVRSTLAADMGKEKITDVLDSLAEENILGKPMDQSAAKFGLKAEKSGLCSQADLQTLLSLKPDAAGAVMATSAGHPVDTPLEAGQRYVVVRVDESVPATFKDLKDVKAEVLSRIKNEKGVALACESLQKALKEGKGALPEAMAKKSKRVEITRGGAIGGFAPNAELDKAIFEAKPGAWMDRVFAVSSDKEQGALACRVVRLSDPDEKEWGESEGIMTELMHRERAEGVYMALMQELFSKANIKVMNTKAIDRENM